MRESIFCLARRGILFFWSVCFFFQLQGIEIWVGETSEGGLDSPLLSISEQIPHPSAVIHVNIKHVEFLSAEIELVPIRVSVTRRVKGRVEVRAELLDLAVPTAPEGERLCEAAHGSHATATPTPTAFGRRSVAHERRNLHALRRADDLHGILVQDARSAAPAILRVLATAFLSTGSSNLVVIPQLARAVQVPDLELHEHEPKRLGAGVAPVERDLGQLLQDAVQVVQRLHVRQERAPAEACLRRVEDPVQLDQYHDGICVPHDVQVREGAHARHLQREVYVEDLLAAG